MNTKGTPLYVNASGNLEKRIQLGPTEIILRVKLWSLCRKKWLLNTNHREQTNKVSSNYKYKVLSFRRHEMLGYYIFPWIKSFNFVYMDGKGQWSYHLHTMVILSKVVKISNGEQTFENKKFVDITQQCFALLPQVNFPANNLNFNSR